MNPAPVDDPWAQLAPADVAAALFALDPAGLGGVRLRAAAGPARDRWLLLLQGWLPPQAPWQRLPLQVGEDRLLGGLDLVATLQAGRSVVQPSLLAACDGGVLLVAMAERLPPATAAVLAAVLDTGVLQVERQGIGLRQRCRLGLVALDEGIDDEQPPPRLNERLAFCVELPPVRTAAAPPWTAAALDAARQRLPAVVLDEGIVQALCAAALALGIDSLRPAVLAGRVARAAAALDGAAQVEARHAAWAARLVLAGRATRLPAPEEAAAQDAQATPGGPDREPPPSPTSEAGPPPGTDTVPPQGPQEDTGQPAPPDGVVLDAALAAMPSGLLASLAMAAAAPARSAAAGRSGAARLGAQRGRPVGVRRGLPRGGNRLHLLETLRAAAPWQPLRRREAAAAGRPCTDALQVRAEDFRVWRFQQRSETTTVFAVDASGSAALHRLAETKGAVELLLADCYARRDSVAVIAFRGAAAELLLPPTRSLVRAKRCLAGLPGGGGTPLAAGLEAAAALALACRRRGATPVLVLLTDGRANIARDGTPGRERAQADALAAARALAAERFAALLLDTSPQPQDGARRLAQAMGARYLPLPHAGAAVLSQAVRQVGAEPPAP